LIFDRAKNARMPGLFESRSKLGFLPGGAIFEPNLTNYLKLNLSRAGLK